jgi:type I restriction enzyme S subunit
MKTPINWKSTLLQRVAEVRSGLSKSAKREGPTVRKPYLRVANVQDGFLDLSEIKKIDVPENQVARFTLKAGDLLLIEGNGNPENLGRGCIWNGQIAECVHQNHVFAVRTLPNAEMLPEFMALQLQSDHGRNYLLSCAKGSTGLSTLNSAQLKEFPLLSPCLAEQRSIVAAIATWDTAIQKTEQLIAAKERHYSHELSRLISRGQHPHTHVGTFAEEVSARNRGGKWRTVALSEICTVWKGQQLNKDAMVEDGAYYALNGGIKPSGRTTEWNCEANTITVSEGGNSCGFVSYNHERFWCGGHCYALKNLANDVDAHYLFHYLKGKEARVMALRVGSGLPNIQKSDIEAFPVVLPGLATQTAIARYLNVLREELDLLGQSVSALKTQKRGLMQKLLTGKWRLPVQEEAS